MAMKLDLSEIAAVIGKNYHYEIRDDRFESEDVCCTKPVVGSVDFTNTGHLIVARGSFKTEIELECGRCLETLRMPVEVKIEENLPITNYQALIAGHEEEIGEEEEEPLFQNNVFDLSEYIRQAIFVQTPIQPLCSNVCKGLCPTCGKNFNEGPCDCPVTIEASPLAVLGELLKEEQEE
jgi:uncharacterized protein